LHVFLNLYLELLTVSFNPETVAEKGPSTNLQRTGVNAASINWNTAGKVTSIKNQGSCGCCWAFTVTSLYESFLLLQGAGSYDLAEEYIL
jgi:C1A family cysteine protease